MKFKNITFIPNSEEIEIASFAPEPSIKFLPSWYKKINKYTNNETKLKFSINFGMPNVSIKRCVPFLDAMSCGYMVILDDDIYVEQQNGEPFIRWRSNSSIITWHSIDQFEGLPIPDYFSKMVAKWENNWTVKTPKKYSIIFTHPFNRIDLPFYTLTGFVDTDKYERPVQFPFLLKKDFEGIIPAGTPICQIIPVKRKKWRSKRIKFNHKQNYKTYRDFFRTFVGSYKKNFWEKKEYS